KAGERSRQPSQRNAIAAARAQVPAQRNQDLGFGANNNAADIVVENLLKDAPNQYMGVAMNNQKRRPQFGQRVATVGTRRALQQPTATRYKVGDRLPSAEDILAEQELMKQRELASQQGLTRKDRFIFHSVCQRYDKFEKTFGINLGSTRCPVRP
ncbi:MAG: hypothetical protein MJK18_11885, partial [Bdellovibrionales bacterium]|nr:hypothetical protein [Bdellovibrionales bacterium]